MLQWANMLKPRDAVISFIAHFRHPDLALVRGAWHADIGELGVDERNGARQDLRFGEDEQVVPVFETEEIAQVVRPQFTHEDVAVHERERQMEHKARKSVLGRFRSNSWERLSCTLGWEQ